MEGHAALARQLVETRVSVAEAVIERLGTRSSSHASTLLVRSLISALGQAIEAASPDPVVSWARMAHGSYTLPVVHELVFAATEVVAQAAEPLEIDFTSLLVFLEIVKVNVSEVLSLSDAPTARSDESQGAASGTIEGILAMLRARDEATCAHAQATGAWCRRLAEALGLSPSMTDTVVKAAILHDIGKIGTPDAILFKPGPLDECEWETMRMHADFGADILAELPALAPYAPIVRAHHERWDGNGYPNGLRGDQIPYEARVVAVADAFHAMISNRPYRAAIGQREAMEILRAGSGTQWDPTVTAAMIALLDAPRTAARRDVASR
jgi:HD-GYP domain-containing protein (c-di-GMP phosphodiesterase class II)